MKTENWNGHEIRFVDINDEWWAVAKDVAEALGLKQVTRAIHSLPKDGVTTSKVIDSLGRTQDVNIINEKNIYRMAFKSRKKEAEAFQDWIFDIIKELRQSTGLEGFQVFRMLDKEHQKSAMQNLKKSLRKPVRVDFIKANVIANKAVSNKHGFPKMIKKAEMTPDMLVERQEILDSTVELMGIKDRYGLKLSVSEEIYASLEPQEQMA
ncbi:MULTISPECIES: BRO-N domain-containing protein [Enterococcus]|uniref:BRO-N domain-containing protein n=1 Tax=Enterococcus TaxID=1350 RepID=UPI0009371266|nr:MULTISPECIES: BRO family protein [Enterococcus]MBC9722312.1 phage repressor protein [Lactobacillus sp.]EME3552283.1 phage repressor protein [Enterococcus faecium]MBX9042099.1 phage repressor protein [Enterococcus durans]MBX9078621.1 phage repressor protein [Enterococcus durans]MDB7366975.1 BRO family protein [Enterococcus faecium]